MSENPDRHSHRVPRWSPDSAFTLQSYVEREEARMAADGPTMDEWLASIDSFRITEMSREWIAATIRECRDADDPRQVDR